EPTAEDAHIAAPQAKELPIATSSEEDVNQTQKPLDGPLATIATAARKLTSQWTCLLASIEEEPLPAPIEAFFNPPTPKAGPTQFEGEQPAFSQEETSAVPPPDTHSAVFRMDFDLGFTSSNVNEKTTPSVPRGLHDLVARTVGIALTVPMRTTCLEEEEEEEE
ncbi:MAG: hypothetical protein LQ341_001818, partial [Variospora aurantia]